ncbi:MAG: ABC transporter permease [Syntrophaceae bacterium]|nr:ABC transporter permease [Syntrophaceae bacterium]
MADTLADTIGDSKRRSSFRTFLERLVRENPLGLIGGIITVFLLFVGIFADFLAPYGMNESNMDQLIKPPSAAHWFGTDNLGRDILSRVIYGARISVIVGLAASSIATVMSLFIGMLSGYIGGKFDMIVQRIVDSVMCVPQLILMMVLITVLGPGMIQIIVALGLMWGIVGSRILRSAVMGIKQNTYVEAARAQGGSIARIILRHIMPNILAPTIILFTTRVPNVILTEASLSFLGFGIPPPTPSWGAMLSGDGRRYMLQAPWMAIWPGLALSVVVFGVNMFGDAVRDLLDPRLRGGAGRFGITPKESIVEKDGSTVQKA